MTGIAGALLTAMAVKANLVLGVTSLSEHHLAFLLFICASAGYSERLVPSLIKQAEASIGKKST